MSKTNYLIIKNLDITLDRSMVIEEMRADFSSIIEQCVLKEIKPVVEEVEFDRGDSALIPVSYNLIIEALSDKVLMKRLTEISALSGYWFFNVFIIPNHLVASIEDDPANGLSKGATRGIDKIL